MLGNIGKEQLIDRMEYYFDMEPTPGQVNFFRHFSEFITSSANSDSFLLRGYAGTGKTTLVRSVIKALASFKINTVLLAPTGRAAKVLSQYSSKQAYTIHKKIYKTQKQKNGNVSFVTEKNSHTDTLFIADEASMIGDSSESKEQSVFQGRRLLEDLIKFVQSGKNCRLMLIGDTAQLPPVGLSESPALNSNYLHRNFHTFIHELELTQVVRQANESGILANATRLRNALMEEFSEFPKLQVNGFRDIEMVGGHELTEVLQSCYDKYGDDNVMVICRSNKRAIQYNREIRNRIKFYTEAINQGDYLMVVKNNYFWLEESEQNDFIANGDIVEIHRLSKSNIEKHGFKFAEASISLLDYPESGEHQVLLLMNTLESENPALSHSDSNRLFSEIYQSFEDVKNNFSRLQKVKNDRYFNALQVKFAYAVTCHKAQGGQWPVVFIDTGYLTEEMLDKDFTRWLYTALTRAQQKVYLVNFSSQLIEQE